MEWPHRASCFLPFESESHSSGKDTRGHLIAPAPPLDSGCQGWQGPEMDAVPADIKCIINETRRRRQGVFQAGYREQTRSHRRREDHGLSRTKIRLKNGPVLEYLSINIYEVSLEKRDISFCSAGHSPVLQNLVGLTALGNVMVTSKTPPYSPDY